MKFIRVDDKRGWILKHANKELLHKIARPLPWHKIDQAFGAVCMVERSETQLSLVVPESHEELVETHKNNWPNVSWYYIPAKEILKHCPNWKEEDENPDA